MICPFMSGEKERVECKKEDCTLWLEQMEDCSFKSIAMNLGYLEPIYKEL